MEGGSSSQGGGAALSTGKAPGRLPILHTLPTPCHFVRPHHVPSMTPRTVMRDQLLWCVTLYHVIITCLLCALEMNTPRPGLQKRGAAAKPNDGAERFTLSTCVPSWLREPCWGWRVRG